MKKYIITISLLFLLEDYLYSKQFIWSKIGGALDITGQNQDDTAGYSVAINSEGTTVTVGEPNWSGGTGRVRVYNLINFSTGSSWIQTGGDMDMTGQNPNDAAGYSVAINSDGTTVAVGEQRWPDGTGNGRVRVYNLIDGAWVATGGALDMAGLYGSFAGNSVAISSDGRTVAMGEPVWNIGFKQGRVRVYNLINGSWVETGGALDMIGQNQGDQAGTSVAISSDGRTVAIGAPGFPGNQSYGRVQVFNLINDLTGSSWIQTGPGYQMYGENPNDFAGSSVALSSDGTTIAIGQPGWSGGTGRVRVYSLVNFLTGNSWVAIGGDMAGQNLNDLAGGSVAISPDGKTVAMGESGWNGGGGTGRVRVYNLVNGSWVAASRSSDMKGQNLGDQAGTSVAISADGKIIVMGEPNWSGGSQVGRAIVFKLQPMGINLATIVPHIITVTKTNIANSTNPGEKRENKFTDFFIAVTNSLEEEIH